MYQSAMLTEFFLLLFSSTILLNQFVCDCTDFSFNVISSFLVPFFMNRGLIIVWFVLHNPRGKATLHILYIHIQYIHTHT